MKKLSGPKAAMSSLLTPRDHRTAEGLQRDLCSANVGSLFTVFSRAIAFLIFVVIAGCGAREDEIVDKREETRSIVPKSKFSDVAEKWGIRFLNSPDSPDDFQLPSIIGSGCAVLDFDRNGHLDILFLAQNPNGPNVAFFSQKSLGKFTECAEEVGLGVAAGRGIAVGDCNNDGWPDFYCTSTDDDQLWLNTGKNSFRNVTREAAISNPLWGASACWLDFDRDGWLDLFVTNYVKHAPRTCTRLGGGDLDFCAPYLFESTRDVLFRNTTQNSADGSPKFEDVSEAMGISRGRSAGLGVTALDFNGDNWIDVYVASDQHPNLLWVNHQETFVDESTLTGCDLDFQGRAQGSMGIALGDITGNGREEITISHLDGESHAVYGQRTGGFYTDLSRETGIATLTRAFTGFGIVVTDFDFDGVNEMLTVNGRVKRGGPKAKLPDDFWSPYRQPIQLLHTMAAGLDLQSTELLEGRSVLARGLAIGDLDRDGDADVVCSTIGEPAVVLRNEYDAGDRGFTLHLVDPKLSYRSCPGAKLTRLLDGRTIEQTFQPCQSYMSCHADELYLTIPSGSETMTVDIVWPHGSMEPERFQFSAVPRSQVTLERGAGISVESVR